MQELQEMYSNWKSGDYTPTIEELSILRTYELVQKYSPEDERPDRELQLAELMDDIKDSE